MKEFTEKLKETVIAYIDLRDESYNKKEEALTKRTRSIQKDKTEDTDLDYPIFINCKQGKSLINDENKVGSKPNLRYDIIHKIMKVQRNKDHQLIFKVSFCKRPSGMKPKSRWYSSRLLKIYAPLQLADFYEQFLNKKSKANN